MTDDDRDWAAYYRHTLGREPRPVFTKGMQLAAEAGRTPGQAVEVGFGDGTETLALLEAGWRVLAVDAIALDEALLGHHRRLAGDLEVVVGARVVAARVHDGHALADFLKQ